MITAMGKQKIMHGPLFRDAKGKRASTADLDVMVHRILERVQKKWRSVIPDVVNVKEEYIVYRSLRRGTTAEAQNAQVPQSVIEANNRWRKQTPGMSVMERYTDAKASVPALIRFSGSM
jgi:hypothetical protein